MKTTTLTIAFSPAPPSVRLLSILMAPALAVIMGIDLRIRGAEEVLVHGVADEVAHLLTALIMLAAVRAIGVPVFWPAVLLGAVLPDIEHLLTRLDITALYPLGEPIGDGGRGVLHTLVPGAGVVLLGLVIPPLRVVLVSLGLALLTHPVRDAATASAPVLWPLLEEYRHLRYSGFLAILAICATVTTGMVALAPDWSREQSPARRDADGEAWRDPR